MEDSCDKNNNDFISSRTTFVLALKLYFTRSLNDMSFCRKVDVHLGYLIEQTSSPVEQLKFVPRSPRFDGENVQVNLLFVGMNFSSLQYPPVHPSQQGM